MTTVLGLLAIAVAIPFVALLRTLGWGEDVDPEDELPTHHGSARFTPARDDVTRTTWDPPGGPDA